MALKIRLSRGGAKKRPFYRIVVADGRAPRDGRFIERLGTYDPLLPRDSEERVKFDAERVKFWLARGAQPTDRVARFFGQAEIIEMPKRNNPQKAKPKAKADAAPVLPSPQPKQHAKGKGKGKGTPRDSSRSASPRTKDKKKIPCHFHFVKKSCKKGRGF